MLQKPTIQQASMRVSGTLGTYGTAIVCRVLQNHSGVSVGMHQVHGHDYGQGLDVLPASPSVRQGAFVSMASVQELIAGVGWEELQLSC